MCWLFESGTIEMFDLQLISFEKYVLWYDAPMYFAAFSPIALLIKLLTSTNDQAERNVLHVYLQIRRCFLIAAIDLQYLLDASCRMQCDLFPARDFVPVAIIIRIIFCQIVLNTSMINKCARDIFVVLWEILPAFSFQIISENGTPPK